MCYVLLIIIYGQKNIFPLVERYKMEDNTNLKIENKKGYLWVSFPKSIVRENILQIRNRVESILTKQPARVVLDLENIDIVGSIVIDLIMLVNKIISGSKGSIHLVNVSETCFSQFQTVNLDKVVTIYRSEDEIQDLKNNH